MYSKILSFMVVLMLVISCHDGFSMSDILARYQLSNISRSPFSPILKAHGEIRPSTPVSQSLPCTVSVPAALKKTEDLQFLLFQSRILQFIQGIEQRISCITSEIQSTEDADDKRALMDIKNMNLKQKSDLSTLMDIITNREISPQKVVTASQVFMEYYNRIIWSFGNDGRTPYTDLSTITRTKDEAIAVARFLLNNLQHADISQNKEMRQQLDSIIKASH